MPTKPNIHYTQDIARIDPIALADLYDSVNFTCPAEHRALPDLVARMFCPGVYGFFAFAGERLVGVARVMSDDLICSWIAEFCVHPEWQRQRDRQRSSRHDQPAFWPHLPLCRAISAAGKPAGQGRHS